MAGPSMGSIPQVASIDSGQQGGQSQVPSLEEIMRLAMPSTPAPTNTQTTLEHVSNPKLPRVSTMPNAQKEAPLTNSVYDIKHARRQNAFAGATSAILNVEKEVQQKHHDEVAHNVTTILNAQHQIDNAQRIINDPNVDPKDKQNAQGVLESQKRVVNRLLDPKSKTSKSLQKAFDVSFVDPTKNDTPEVKAMQAGQKQFEISKNSGLNVDNPQEKRVQDLANNMNSQQSVDSAHQSGLKVRGQDAPTSTYNSYADQFLKQQPNALGVNPAYVAAVKQQEENQKAASKILPSMINQQGATDRANINANQRDLANQRTEQARVQAASIAAKARTDAMAIEQSNANRRMAAQIESREELMTMKDQSSGNQQKLALDIIKIAQGGIKSSQDTITKYETMKIANGYKPDKPAAEQYAKNPAFQNYDNLINDAKKAQERYSQTLQDANLRLSNLGYKGSTNNGQPPASTTTVNRSKITDGNSSGSDDEPEDPDEFDTRP